METRHGCSQMLVIAILMMCSTVARCDDVTDGAEDDTDPSSYASKRQSSYSPMWFGPRLGRNKRTLYDVIQSAPSTTDGQHPTFDQSIMDLFRDSTWALVPIRGAGNERKNEISSAALRLGRTEDDEEAMEASRSPPFAPRLGRRRHLVQFSPRLGRTFSGPGSSSSNALQ